MTNAPEHQPRLKNLIGMFILIFGLMGYAFLAAYIGEVIAQIWWILTIPYYIAAGILWIWPARALLRWMAPKEPSD